MSRIKSKGSKIEMKMKKALDESLIEYDYQPKIYGKPDFLVKPKIAVFCDSSFWHGRDWKSLKPRLKEGYWREHIQKNRKRDKSVNIQLMKKGFIVLRFWDDQIEKDLDFCLARIEAAVKSQV